MKIRNWSWVTNSRIDLLDFRCSLTIFVSGLFLMFQDPERFARYTHFDDPVTTKYIASTVFSAIGLLNLIKLFVPLKPPIMVNSVMKSFNFMMFMLLVLCETTHLHAFPLTIVFYSIFSVMSLQNLLKTR